MKYLHLPLLSFFGFLMAVSNCWAASGSGISVAPVFQEVSFDAQQDRSDFLITLKNETSQTVVLRPSVFDFGSLDESGGVAFLGTADALERKYGLASWMRLGKDVIFLEAGEVEQLSVTVENRESLSPGGHYGAVVFQVGSGDDALPKDNRVAVNQLVSVLVFAKKTGGEIYSVELKEVDWSRNPFLIPKSLRLRFQNAGNVYVTPRGVVTVTDPVGRVVGKGSINPESGLVLPETQRVYVTALSLLTRALFPGWYILETRYRFDGKDEFLVTQERFFLFPWEGGVVFFVLATLFFWRTQTVYQKNTQKNK
ncbi:MAG: hypothetical protein KBA91_01215 [Candidatus Moranbacteria bacterium]|jgi:hypothetical protein|nr:hypothetical protein [Candidatus Moranbacteria bacterium]